MTVIRERPVIVPKLSPGHHSADRHNWHIWSSLLTSKLILKLQMTRAIFVPIFCFLQYFVLWVTGSIRPVDIKNKWRHAFHSGTRPLRNAMNKNQTKCSIQFLPISSCAEYFRPCPAGSQSASSVDSWSLPCGISHIGGSSTINGRLHDEIMTSRDWFPWLAPERTSRSSSSSFGSSLLWTHTLRPL